MHDSSPFELRQSDGEKGRFALNVYAFTVGDVRENGRGEQQGLQQITSQLITPRLNTKLLHFSKS